MKLNLFKNMKFNQQMYSVPIIFFVGAVTLLVSFSWQLASQQKFTAGVNLAGRQRMLNQRHAREILEIADGGKSDYRATRKLMTNSLAVLRDGAEHEFGTIAPATDSKLQFGIMKQKKAFEKTFESADQFLAAVKSAKSEKTQAKIRSQLIADTGEAHKAAHGVVLTMNSLAKKASARGAFFAYILGGFVVTFCSLWALFIGRSAAKVIRVKAQSFADLSKLKLQKISSGLRTNSISTAKQANQASGAAEQVSSNATSLTNAVEQFEESIKEIAGNASGAASVAQNAVDAAERTNNTISRLGESSSEIGNVIKVINSIAEQTNLLALNATIEAARAGEAGKGFAVVANEVKELAKETSKATEDIIKRIEAIQTDTGEAVNAIGQVSQIITEINESQNAIAGAVEEQSAMTSEISRNISEVASRSGEIAQNISSVADTAESTTADSEVTLNAADDIEKMALELLQFVGETSTAVKPKAESYTQPNKLVSVNAKVTSADKDPSAKGKYRLP